MDNGIDRYLHKKFKKQLSIEPRIPAKSEDIVPTTHSTNNNKTSVNNLSVLNYVRSSISNNVVTASVKNNDSLEPELDSNRNLYGEQSADISYVKVSVSQTEPTNLVTQSSILNNFYTPQSNEKHDEEQQKVESSTIQQEKGSTGGKYVCTYCNLACSKPSVLQKHIRAHTNERPYPCHSCGFSFKTRSNLYKHCRSRTHANRVMGNKAQEINSEAEGDSQSKPESLPQNNPDPPETTCEEPKPEMKPKPYKPRFHTVISFYDNENENTENKHSNPELISIHINELIDKNNTIVNNSEDSYLLKRRGSSEDIKEAPYKPDYQPERNDEPLNLTNKNRKRCLSEVSEPVAQKSLIKELLLKNLYADSNMQCPHCKMIFQTVTELELHKMRNCKGFTKSGPRYSRSSSVNVASILTQNKNAFDNIPQMQNAAFPLKSPGPFLGKTRLVDSDKSKSFSFEDGISQFASSDILRTSHRYSLSPLTLPYDKAKIPPVKLFGGEVKITQTSGETKSFKIDGKEQDKYHSDGNYEYGGKFSENRVVKSTLQSGGTVLQNKPSYNKEGRKSPEAIRVYDQTPGSPSIDIKNLEKTKFQFDNRDNNYDVVMRENVESTEYNAAYNNKYMNIMDFSQNAAKLLVPNLKQLNLTIPGLPMPAKFIETSTPLLTTKKPHDQIKTDPKLLSGSFYNRKEGAEQKSEPNGIMNPMNLIVNGKVVRYVPGMPGPVIAEPETPSVITSVPKQRLQKPNIMITPVDSPQSVKPPEEERARKMETLEVKAEMHSPKSNELRSPKSPEVPRKFARPNSLALKPTVSSLKLNHGLTPTMFNQILISPDTPRGAKKYNEHFLHGNYFSYLGLKSSTKPVYCTLNKTQPFYVPHFKKLSMYSEWRQQDNKSDKLYVSAYDSRQKNNRVVTAGKYEADYIVHSSYKFNAAEANSIKEESQRANGILGGYESNEDYTYVRGRGRGRYVCDQCGIRCKKPSMLKKHIRTHSNDRPYTCKHCNFSFKTKGNLTKHMKSKAHTKNYAANSTGSSAHQSGTPSSDSETEDSGMDSSDESSTRQQEHEAAYGLLSLSQKTTTTPLPLPLNHLNNHENTSPSSNISNDVPTHFMDTEQLVHVSKKNYAKNKILDQQFTNTARLCEMITTHSEESNHSITQYLGRTSTARPLTYPYTTVNASETDKPEASPEKIKTPPPIERKNIIHFNVIKRYNTANNRANKPENVADNKSADEKVLLDDDSQLRKRKLVPETATVFKMQKNDEVMDLSMAQEEKAVVYPNGAVSYDKNRRYEAPDNGVLKIRNNFNYVPNGRDAVFPHNSVRKAEDNSRINVSYIVQVQETSVITDLNNKNNKTMEYDNSAMETLADIATKQEKLEKNSVAKNVATEFLKLATKNEHANGEDKPYTSNSKDVKDLVGKSEENKSCTICSKNFSKPSQLRLHMNIHYLERPFKCESCSVSFRTKGHLQKHERSASHHNKLSSSPALASSEPRPFKCGDCNIAFRIHGHLAKHLRSKMHIMKLECLAKIPFGLYAELERSNSLLTEINTADGDQCLDSLKMLAKKVFMNDPSKLIQLEERSSDQPEMDLDS